MKNNQSTENNASLSTDVDQSLLPKTDRTVSGMDYICMWLGDGVNLGNMTLGAGLVVAGVAVMNAYQTFVAALVAIGIISTLFALNDRFGYKTGVPYVIQLRLSFGIKGAVVSSLLRGIPAIVWYGFQSWIGASALNEILKVLSGHTFDNAFICFFILQAIQIGLSMYGFHAVKWVEMIVSIVILSALIYVFYILMAEHSTVIKERWIDTKGTWGIEFFAFIMMFMGNYAAIFLSAADYSRELKKGISDTKRALLYFVPIVIAYGFVLAIGAMLASVTGISNPVVAFPKIVNNDYITVAVSLFIVLGAIAVNMVANIIPPTYVITLLTKLKYRYAVIITGILAGCTFPWILVNEESAKGLGYFILIYSAFLGPIVSILLVDYFILRNQQVNIQELYNSEGVFKGINPGAIIAMLIGAIPALIFVKLAWIIGFVLGGISYYILMKTAFKDSQFYKHNSK
ncbi:NCS1 family transporter [Thorsellia kenyensis]|uniref:NCS1 family transporter n=1 Tax=Thorsellia kenyensis TaxID=1549888 RepID=A0ABV6C8C6_9GAMM